MAFERLDGLPAAEIPHYQRLIHRGRDRCGSIGAERDTTYPACMAAEGLARRSRRHIPKDHGLVLGAGERVLAVGAEHDRAHVIGMAFEQPLELARVEVPQD